MHLCEEINRILCFSFCWWRLTMLTTSKMNVYAVVCVYGATLFFSCIYISHIFSVQKISLTWSTQLLFLPHSYSVVYVDGATLFFKCIYLSHIFRFKTSVLHGVHSSYFCLTYYAVVELRDWNMSLISVTF